MILILQSKDGAVVRALASHQGGPGSIPRVVVIYGLSLFNADVSSRQRYSKRVLPILPTTSQLLCQKTLLALTIPPATQASFHAITSVFASPQKTVFSYSSNARTKSLKEFLGTPECFRDKQITTFFQLNSDMRTIMMSITHFLPL